jgi:hypothetical protein
MVPRRGGGGGGCGKESKVSVKNPLYFADMFFCPVFFFYFSSLNNE